MTKYEQLITKSEETIKAENLSFNLEQSKLNMSTGINQMKSKVLEEKSALSKVEAKGSIAKQALSKAQRKQPLCPQSLLNAYAETLDHEDSVKEAKNRVEYAEKMLKFLEDQQKDLFAEVKA